MLKIVFMLRKSWAILCMLDTPSGVWLIWYDLFSMYTSGHSFVTKNKNHCYCNFLFLNFPPPRCAQWAFHPISVKNFINTLICYGTMILNVIFGTCHKKLLSVISYLCRDWAIYTDLLTLTTFFTFIAKEKPHFSLSVVSIFA